MPHDAGAWETLTAVYSPPVYPWCHRAGLETSDAADVVQEVFCAVARALDSFQLERSGDTFRGRLWTINRHRFANIFANEHVNRTP